jgi:folylpolyglutamate synthase
MSSEDCQHPLALSSIATHYVSMAAFCRLPTTLRHALMANPPSIFGLLQCSFSTSTRRSAGRTYPDALELLEKLQSNREVRSAISDTSGDMNLQAMPEMLAWTRKAGYNVQDFAQNGLRCIHVAGTKGKGSVCVMIENILLQYRMRGGGAAVLGKIGLYTSPHLVHVRERIRIDGSPISETLFARYFFELWDRFSEAAALDSGVDPSSVDTKPGYFRYLTLLAFHTFIQEGVETAIVECGIGGEYDSTNILPAEAVTVTAITPLGIDHAGILGETIEDIAWHKSGIIKCGVPTYSAKQVPEAQAILKSRASVNYVKLGVVERLPFLDDQNSKLGLDGDFQRDNASLAAVVAASHLLTMGLSDGVPLTQDLMIREGVPREFITGLETATWPGRCQYIKDGNTEWFIDGAHTKESLQAAASWFASKSSEAKNSSKPPTATMLIFNQQDRDAEPLLKSLINTLNSKLPSVQLSSATNAPSYYKPRIFTYAAFCTNQPFKRPSSIGCRIDITPQKLLAKIYSRIDANQLYMVYESAEEAVHLAYKISEGDERLFVLVTGSLHLVGAVLKVLDRRGVDVGAKYESGD